MTTRTGVRTIAWMDWKDFLTAGERRTLEAIRVKHAFDMEVKRRIYDRCRKRMKRKTKREQETLGENSPANPHKTVGGN